MSDLNASTQTLKHFDVTKKEDFNQVMDIFGGEDNLKKELLPLYEAFVKRAQSGTSSRLKSESETGFKESFELLIKDEEGQIKNDEEDRPYTSAKFVYTEKQPVVITDIIARDKTNDKTLGGDTFCSYDTNTDTLKLNLNKATPKRKEFDLEITATFTKLQKHQDGSLLLEDVKQVVRLYPGFITGVSIFAESKIMDPAPFKSKSSTEVIYYGEGEYRAGGNYNYQVDTYMVGNDKFLECKLPLFGSIRLDKAIFSGDNPILIDDDFSMSIESLTEGCLGTATYNNAILSDNFTQVVSEDKRTVTFALKEEEEENQPSWGAYFVSAK